MVPMMLQLDDNPVLAVDVALFTAREHTLEVLLARRPRPPFAGCWALPGSLVRRDEPLDAAALRALGDLAGIQGVFLEQLYTFGRPGRDPRGRVVSVSFYALVRPDQVAHVGEGDRETGWFPVRG